jgi:hypothetical protein
VGANRDRWLAGIPLTGPWHVLLWYSNLHAGWGPAYACQGCTWTGHTDLECAEHMSTHQFFVGRASGPVVIERSHGFADDRFERAS